MPYCKVCYEYNSFGDVHCCKNLYKKESILDTSSEEEEDEGGPEKPITGFIFFSNLYKNKIKEKHPKLTFGEVSKKAGERWRSLSEEKKEKYQRMAKKRYEEEREREREMSKEESVDQKKSLSFYIKKMEEDAGMTL